MGFFWDTGWKLTRSPLLPAELSRRQKTPNTRQTNACVGLIREITFNSNASSRSSPGSPRAVLGLGAGASTLRGQQRHRNVPRAGCLRPGLARGCGGGGAHRPCSSSRKLNERKKKGIPLPRAPKHLGECKSASPEASGMTQPRQGTTGGVFGRAKRPLLLPSLPRHQRERGWEWAALSPPGQGKAPTPRNKQHNQTNEKKKKPTSKNHKNTVITS